MIQILQSEDVDELELYQLNCQPVNLQKTELKLVTVPEELRMIRTRDENYSMAIIIVFPK